MTDESPSASAKSSPALDRLVEVIERLHRDHRVSFIAAGDQRVYAYGGGGYVAIVSDQLFDGAVDIEAPTMKLRVERDADGRLVATSATAPEGPADGDLSDIADGLERYYARRIGTV